MKSIEIEMEEMTCEMEMNYVMEVMRCEMEEMSCKIMIVREEKGDGDEL